MTVDAYELKELLATGPLLMPRGAYRKLPEYRALIEAFGVGKRLERNHKQLAMAGPDFREWLKLEHVQLRHVRRRWFMQLERSRQ